MSRYLVFTSLDAAQYRSATHANDLQCDGEATTHWWNAIENATTGQGALVIEDEGPFGVSHTVVDAEGNDVTVGLMQGEIDALWTEAEMDPSWFPAPPQR